MVPHASASEQFDRNAEKYRDEPLFAAGEDLERMVRSVTPSGRERLLDVGAGAGHVALAFAPHVRECTGIDISERMVGVARDFARERGVPNVTFQAGRAEALPFPDASFEIVTCRFTAHHFVDLPAAVAQIARVLTPGGTLVVVDHYAPEDRRLDRFVNDLDRMRDASHVRECTLSEWKAMLAQHELQWRQIAAWDLPLELQRWLDRAGTPEERREQIFRHLASAPAPAAETFRIERDGEGRPLSFSLKVALFHGVRGGSEDQSTRV